MSGFFDELEQRLRDAAQRQGAAAADVRPPSAAPYAPCRAWMRRHRRLLVVVAAALVGLAVPAVAAVTDLWRPDVRPSPPMRTAPLHAGPAYTCRHVSSPPLDVGPPVGRAFTSVLGVLARPRTSADAFDLRYLRAPGLLGVDVAGIRYLGTAPGGTRSYVVAARGFAAQPSWPARCLRRLSPAARRHVVRPARHEPTICVFGGGSSCTPLAVVRAQGTFGSFGTVRGRATVAGLAPNGVRVVRISYGRSTRVFPVRDNFFSFAVAIDVERAAPDRVEWLMDDGSVRDVTPGRPRNRARTRP